jgi:hypothetical protein
MLTTVTTNPDISIRLVFLIQILHLDCNLQGIGVHFCLKAHGVIFITRFELHSMLRECWDWYVDHPRMCSVAFNDTSPFPKMIAALGLIFPEIGVERIPELLRTSLIASFSLLLAAVIQSKSDVSLSKVDELIVLNVSGGWALVQAPALSSVKPVRYLS